MTIIANLLVKSLAVFITAYVLQAGVKIDSFITAIVFSVVLGLVNVLIKPFLFLFTLPLNILTLGLFTFIVNGLVILITSAFIPGFSVINIWWAILFSLILSLVNSFLTTLTK